MGIKKRNKVSAEFSMSSLTDIIFLLLIFFMLTSSLVAPNALNLKLPGPSKPSNTPPSQVDKVDISSSGRYYFNGVIKSEYDLEKDMRGIDRRNGKKVVVIAPKDDTPTEAVVAVMDIALRFDIEAILAAERK